MLASGASGGAGGPDEQLPRASERLALGVGMVAEVGLLVYLLACLWPVVIALDDSAVYQIHVFGLRLGSFNPDLALLWAIAILGALGGSLHALGSFVNYAGNRSLVRSWYWFYVARAPIGMGLAVLVYFGIRGGLLSPAAAAASGPRTLNPYGLGALAALTGLFSEIALLKLREVFTALFRPEEVRKNPLSDTAPSLETLDPASVPSQNVDKVVTLRGSGFQQGDTVLVNGEAVKTEVVGETEIKATIVAAKLAQPGRLSLTVHRAAPSRLVSEARELVVT